MSFPSTLTLLNHEAGDVAFTKTSDDASSVTYSRDDSTVGLPVTLTLSHKVAKIGIAGVDKHTLRYSYVAADVNGALFYLPVTLTINKPRQIITEAIVRDGVAVVKSFLTEARLSQLLRNEC